MKEFIIPFFGLKEGKHEFEFDINHAFFEAFENSLLDTGDIQVVLNLDKSNTMLQLTFEANGTTRVPCDRCGDDFDLPLHAEERIIVKFGDESFEQTDDIVIVSHDTHEIDVSQYIYEMLILSLPNKRVHPDPEDCNRDAIQRLNTFKSNEANSKTTDPRWDALNKLKN